MTHFFYNLNQNPPHILAKHEGGWTYKIYLNGQTNILFSGAFEVPAPGCPCPDAVVRARFFRFVLNHGRALAIAFFAVVALASLQFLLMHLPGNDEMYWAFISLFSFWMNAALLVGFILTALALLIWNFGKGLHYNFAPKQQADTPLLDAGQISIDPDILISYLSADESADNFADRMETARAGQIPGQWIVVLAYQNPAGIIVRNTSEDEDFSGFTFVRDNPPYQGADWPLEMRIVPPGQRFEKETWADYIAYLNTFTIHYPEWAKWAKTKIGNPADALADAMRATAAKAAATIVLLLLCSLAAFSQKSAQVAKYLGDRYTTEKPTGEVRFVFEKGTVRRAGNGQKTWKEILPNAAMYTDADNAGKLTGITANGQTVPRAEVSTSTPPVGVASGTKPVSAVPVPPSAGRTFWEAVPDSNKLEGYKAEMLIAKQQFGREMSPRLEFLMWCFLNFLLPLLFLIGGAAYYLAKVAAGESAIGIGGFTVFGHNINAVRERATFVIAACVWITAIIILIDQLLKAYFFSGSLWWFFFKGCLIIMAAYKLSNWLIPNPRIVNTGHPSVAPNNLPQLNR